MQTETALVGDPMLVKSKEIPEKRSVEITEQFSQLENLFQLANRNIFDCTDPYFQQCSARVFQLQRHLGRNAVRRTR